MNNKQFEAVVSFFERKVALIEETGDEHPGEPWHLALAGLTDVHYSHDVRIEAVRKVEKRFVDDAYMMYALTGIEGYASDAIQAGIIAVALEMAEKVAAATELPEEAVA